MPRELSDAELAHLANRKMVADFAESVFNDPACSKDLTRIIKRKDPNLAIPDLDIEDKLDARFAADDKRRADEAAAENERKLQAEADKWKADRAAVQKEYGFTDEAMSKLDEMMKERLVADYEIAASWMASKEPKTSEVTYDQTRWHHERTPGWQDIAKDPEAWGRNEIMKALNTDAQRQRGK
jgi:Cdc6-like AAA superfamily ATPase